MKKAYQIPTLVTPICQSKNKIKSRLFRRCRHSKNFSALCSTSTQHSSSTTCFFSCSETVGSFTTLVMWLECSFHDVLLCVLDSTVNLQIQRIGEHRYPPLMLKVKMSVLAYDHASNSDKWLGLIKFGT